MTPAEDPARTAPPRRRACLVVPASAPEKLAKVAKAGGLGADEIVIDLEDAVVPAAKAEARAAVVAALGALEWPAVALSVRVNGRGTPWCEADLAALAAAPGPLRSIVLPKVERGEDVAFAVRTIDAARPSAGDAAPPAVQALIETAAGIARAQEIAAASERLEALIVGYADLAVSLGRTAAGAADPARWDTVRELVLLAARVHGLQAIDGPHLGLAPDEAFHAAAGRAREQGFDGKWAIHPSQLAPLCERFGPTAGEVAHARAVIDALAAAEAAGQGAVALDGRMLDEPVRLAALRVLAAAEEPA
jgi:citrate lyase subunit beta/citryl-CoA lyase